MAVSLVRKFYLSKEIKHAPQAELKNANSGQRKGVRLSLRKRHLENSRAGLYSSPECGWLVPALSYGHGPSAPLDSSTVGQRCGGGAGLQGSHLLWEKMEGDIKPELTVFPPYS